MAEAARSATRPTSTRLLFARMCGALLEYGMHPEMDYAAIWDRGAPRMERCHMKYLRETLLLLCIAGGLIYLALGGSLPALHLPGAATAQATMTAVPPPPAPVQVCMLADYNSASTSCIQDDSSVSGTDLGGIYIAWGPGVASLELQIRDGAGNWFTQGTAYVGADPGGDTLMNIEEHAAPAMPTTCGTVIQIVGLSENGSTLGSTQTTITCG